jgi:AraC-like DNA-binding protein
MAFNPDDPHDGAASDELGFTYRMIHIGPELVGGALADITGRAAGLPLFPDPVISDPVLARKLLGLHRALLGSAATLRRDELLAGTIHALVRRAATGSMSWSASRAPTSLAAATTAASRARELISGSYLTDLSLGDLAAAADVSRFSIHRAFQAAYGMAPSDYQRQLRLRGARRLLAQGEPISDAAARTGFADQSHLTRWFTRYYGVTPGIYQRGVAGTAATGAVR